MRHRCAPHSTVDVARCMWHACAACAVCCLLHVCTLHASRCVPHFHVALMMMHYAVGLRAACHTPLAACCLSCAALNGARSALCATWPRVLRRRMLHAPRRLSACVTSAAAARESSTREIRRLHVIIKQKDAELIERATRTVINVQQQWLAGDVQHARSNTHGWLQPETCNAYLATCNSQQHHARRAPSESSAPSIAAQHDARAVRCATPRAPCRELICFGARRGGLDGACRLPRDRALRRLRTELAAAKERSLAG